MNSTAKILIVDDDPGVRYFLKETLADDGYQVIIVESGEAALECIEAQEFDLALLDLKMPGIGGMEVLAALHQRSPDTITIVFTAHASLETAVEAVRRGAHDYLFKPCDTDQLRDSVRTGLAKRRRKLRHDQVLDQLEQSLSENLEDILTTAIERAIAPEPEPVQEQKRFLQRGGLIVDLVRHVVTLDGHMLELGPTEFDLLTHLAGAAPRVVSPQELAHEVLEYEGELWEVRDVVRSCVYRTRQKIKAVVGDVDVIHTVRGKGYTIGDGYT